MDDFATHYQSNPLCPVTGKDSTVLTICGIYCKGELGKHNWNKVTCPKCLSKRDEHINHKLRERFKEFNYYNTGGDNGPTGHGDVCFSDDETI